MGRLRTAVLISGRGSNLQALIDAAANPAFPAEIVVVVANRADAAGLARAARARIATEIIEHRNFKSRAAFENALDGALARYRVEFICLAGFMRILTADFVNRWHGRLINIHPSLLPKFKGLDTHARALEAIESETGCTIHFVSPGMDEGPIICQAKVPIYPDDDVDSLAARVLEQEHIFYPRVLSAIAEGRVRLTGDHVEIDRAI